MDGCYRRLSRDEKAERARALWDKADPDLDDTPAGVYLRTLGGKPPWPSQLRFSSNCWNGPAGLAAPALIAGISDLGGRITGIQRSYLSDDGAPAVLSPRRLLLGGCAGSAVRIGRLRPGEELTIAESLGQALRLHFKSGRAVWSALSAAGIARLMLPDNATRILILPTSDRGRRAAEKAINRWRAETRSIRVSDEHHLRIANHLRRRPPFDHAVLGDDGGAP
jgi:DNA primase